MQPLVEFIPLLLFFGIYLLKKDLFLATAVLILATLLQVAYGWWKKKQLEKMPLFTAGLVTLFGGLTLYFHEPQFLIWKVSIANWAFALLLLGSLFLFKQDLLQKLIGQQIPTRDFPWTRLNLAWALFFIGIGLLNLWVAATFSQDVWVKFKVLGLMGLTFLAIVGTVLWISRYALEPPADANAPGKPTGDQ